MENDNHVNVAVLTERLERLVERVEKLDAYADSQRTRVNAILGGVVVACILLVVNVVIEALRAL